MMDGNLRYFFIDLFTVSNCLCYRGLSSDGRKFKILFIYFFFFNVKSILFLAFCKVSMRYAWCTCDLYLQR